MDFLDRLRMLSRRKGLENNMQLSKASGVPYTTLDNFYRNGYENVKLSTLKKLAVCLDCTIEYLVNGDSESDSPSAAAMALAERIDALDSHAIEVIRAVIRVEEKRIEERRSAAAYLAELPTDERFGVPVGIAYQDGTVEAKYAAKKELKEMQKEKVEA